jgi:hypothetical protein
MSSIVRGAVAGRSSRDHAEEHSGDQYGNDGGKGSNSSHGFLLQFGSCRRDTSYAASNARLFPFGCTMFQVKCAHWCANAPARQSRRSTTLSVDDSGAGRRLAAVNAVQVLGQPLDLISRQRRTEGVAHLVDLAAPFIERERWLTQYHSC